MAHLSPSATASAAAINKRIKTIAEPLIAKSPVFAMVQQKGNMEMNCGGLAIEWPVRYRRRSITAGSSPLQVYYPEFNRLLKAEVPYRVYNLGEGLTKFTELAIKNDPNSYIGNALDTAMKWTTEDFMKDLAYRVYVDGAATGSYDIYGFESLFGASAVASDARVGTPTGSYAGVTCTLGTYGGSWTAETDEAWPTGSGSDNYGFWAPLEIDTTNTKWSDSTKTFAKNWQEQVSWAIAMMESRNDESPDSVLLTPHMWQQARNNVLNNQRFELTTNKDKIEAGIKAMTLEGIDFITDGRIVDGAGTGVGYLVTFSKIRVCCMGSQLVETDRDFDLTTKNRQWHLDSHLNMAFESPCYFGKFVAIS